MLILLIAAIAATMIGFHLFHFSVDRFFAFDWLVGIFGALLAVAGITGLIATICFAVEWRGADVKANLINREYGTVYTQEEVFYASSVINTIRELDRKRIEVNGDLFRDTDQKED